MACRNPLGCGPNDYQGCDVMKSLRALASARPREQTFCGGRARTGIGVLMLVLAAAVVPAAVAASKSHQVELKPPNEGGSDRFGYVTAVSGNTLAVGAPSHKGEGAAYIYTRVKGAWKLTATLKGHDTKAGDEFGQDAKISGNEVIIGASSADGAGGRAYIFKLEGSKWKQVAELAPSMPQAGTHYGLSVAIDGSEAIVGTEYAGLAYSHLLSRRGRGVRVHTRVRALEADELPQGEGPGHRGLLRCRRRYLGDHGRRGRIRQHGRTSLRVRPLI
jgi:hypothetical protein